MDTSSPTKNMLPKIEFIDPKNGLEFSQEWKKLLIAAFAKADWIHIVKPLSGYSGAQTWSVQTTTGGNSQLFVVKFDQPKRLRKEYDRCMEFVVGGGLYGTPVKPEGEIFHGEGQWALMKATLAGSDQSDTLFAHLDQEGAAYFKIILQNTFTSDNRWRKNMQRFPIRYGAYYERLLPEHFRFEGVDGVINNAYSIEAHRLERDRLKIENDLAEKSPLVNLQNFQVIRVNGRTITLTTESSSLRIKYLLSDSQSPPEEDQPALSLYGRNPKSRIDLLQHYASDVRSAKKNKKTFDYRRIKFANPLFYLQKLLDNTGELKLATIHGDLNLRNILVALNKHNTADPKVWLIDFADTGLGPVLLDFQWLEVQVILWLLAPMIRKGGVAISNLIDLFKALHECDVDLMAHLNPKLETSYKLMRQIRLLAQEHLVGDWSEYYHGLTLALLGALRLRESVTDLDEFAPRVAFLSAATVLSWAKVIPADDLKGISETLWPPPKPLNGTPPPPPPPIPVSIDPITTTIWLGQPFMLSGSGQPGSKLEVSVNGQLKVETFTNESGKWRVEIPPFTESGNYQLCVNDVTCEGEEAKLSIQVTAPLTFEKKFSRRKLLAAGTLLIGGSGLSAALFTDKGQYYVDRVSDILRPYIPQPKPKHTVRIGIAYDQKGTNSPLGSDQWTGYTIAQKNFSGIVEKEGFLIELKPFNTNTDRSPKQQHTQDGFQRLIDEDVVALIGPTLSRQAFGADCVAEKNKTPIIGPSNTADNIPQIGEYIFRVSAPVAQYAGIAVQKAYENGASRVALAYVEGDEFTRSEIKAFEGAVNENKLTLLPPRPFPKDADFATLATDIIDEGPNLVIISALPDEVRDLTTELRNKGFKEWIIVGNGMNASNLFNFCPACDKVLIAQAYSYKQNTEINSKFVEAYKQKQKTNDAPWQFTAQAFTALQIITEALININKEKQLHSWGIAELRTRLRDQLLKMEFPQTPLGKISFDKYGEIQQTDFYVATIERSSNDNSLQRTLSEVYILEPYQALDAPPEGEYCKVS